jgi:3-methyladenine DNA glycosylase AlkD
MSMPELKTLDRTLKDFADPKHRAVIRDHFGSNADNFYGVKMGDIREVTESVLQAHKITNERCWSFCDELTATGIFEHKIAAFHLAWLVKRKWTGSELDRFAGWLHHSVDDWMDCDDLCNRVIGEFLLRFPDQIQKVVSWRNDPGVWTRRGSAVSLVPSVRKGYHWKEAVTVCETIMNDPEPMVTKACGWLLKVASKPHPEEVQRFVKAAGTRMLNSVRKTALEKL